MTDLKLLNAALEYVENKWSIVPLVGKQPPQGFQWGKFMDKSATEEEVRGWFMRFQNLTGIGIITGYVEDICILDLEAEENPARFELPETVMARSGGGGWHYYFKMPTSISFDELRTVNLRKHGITGELRADGSYTTLPPSTHPNGKKYEWVVPLDYEKLAPIPKWLLDLTEKETWEPKDWSEIMKGATEGGRHTTTVSLAGKLLYHLPQTEWDTLVLPVLMTWNKEHNDPPLPEGEVMSIYKSLAQKQVASRKGKEHKEFREVTPTPASLARRTLLSVSTILGMPDSDKPDFLVNMLVPERGITALSGHPGCGKSWFMLHMAQCVATGERFLGELQTKKGNVLIIDEESGVWEMQRRMKLLGYPEDIPIYFYCQSGFKVDREKDLDELLRTVVDQNIKLVIIDPFVAIHSGVENNAEEAQVVMEKIQRFNDVGASVLFIHHHRKGAGGGGQSLRGSSAFSGRLDSHITVEKSNETQTTTSLDIEHVKSRRGKSLAQFRVLLTQETPDSPITFTHDEGISEKAIKKEKARKIIVELLKLGGLTTDEIIDEVQKENEIGSRNILQALKDLETDNIIVSKRDGKKKKYILAVPPEQMSLFENTELVNK